jgi:hypothetical protein
VITLVPLDMPVLRNLQIVPFQWFDIPNLAHRIT